MPHPKGDDTQPKPITHQTAGALLHERPGICEKHIWNQITSKLGVYRYTSDGTIEFIENSNIQCVSPLQIMMSNGRYYVIAKNERKFRTQDFLFYRIDLMDEIEIIETKRRDVPGKVEWKDPQKFLISNPFFYSGEKEDIVIGFEEQQITQVVDWFGTEENGLFECLGTYYMQKTRKEKWKDIYG